MNWMRLGIVMGALASVSPAFSQPPPSNRPVSAPADPAALQDPEGAALRGHGIGLTNRDLVTFLEKGFPRNLDAARMPERPQEKSQLAVYAMARLAQAKATEAVPVLVSIAAMNLPEGVAGLVRIDVNQTSPGSREDFRQKAIRILQFNAINALGIIGDPLALPVVRAAFANESSPGARIQYAITMAALGDAGGTDALVGIIQAANRRESAAAARAFYIITGQDFGFTENTPIRARKTRAAAYAQWWQANRMSFRPDREAVAARRIEPVKMPAFQPRSTRDLLKLSAFYFDFSNRFRTFEARDRISQAGRTMNPDLLRIMNDPMEDLDVRMEAMNWYFEFNRTESRKVFQRLRRDENPEIAEKARVLIDDADKRSATPPRGQ